MYTARMPHRLSGCTAAAVLVLASFSAPLTGTTTVRRLEAPAGAGSGMFSLVASPSGDVLLSWIEPLAEKGHAFRVARLDGTRWRPPATIATGDDWFVNWADHPSVAIVSARTFVAHWLVRSGAGAATYGYGIRVARSDDGGLTWRTVGEIGRDSDDDYSGFVTWLVEPGRVRLAYLAPRDGHHGGQHDEAAKTLVIATVTPSGIVRDSMLTLDDDTCQCCTTSAALTSEGAVIAYRDHLPGEIRDIAIVREASSNGDRGPAGARSPGWTAPVPVARDGWVMPGCPTNGPVVTASHRRVAVAWFTAAHDAPRVKLAFSDDAGATFDTPIEVGAEAPHGWPAIVMLDDWSAVVSWMEGTGADGDVRLRRVWRDGRMSSPLVVAKVRAGRAAGIPQMVRHGDSLIVAWRSDRVETAVVDVPGVR